MRAEPRLDFCFLLSTDLDMRSKIGLPIRGRVVGQRQNMTNRKSRTVFGEKKVAGSKKLHKQVRCTGKSWVR